MLLLLPKGLASWVSGYSPALSAGKCMLDSFPTLWSASNVDPGLPFTWD